MENRSLFFRLAILLLYFLLQPRTISGFSGAAGPRRNRLTTLPHCPRTFHRNPRHDHLMLFQLNESVQHQKSKDSTGLSLGDSSLAETNFTAQPDNTVLHKLKRNKQKVAISALAIATCCLGYAFRKDILSLLALVNIKGAKLWLRQSLDKLNNAGSAGLAAYAILFCLWNMVVGVSVPVETAAGFAFGAKRAILANAIGKTMGALTAFCLGRFIFYEAVHKKLQNNEFIQLVEESVEERPFLVALMVRLSPLPEPIKNLGMSVLDVKSRYYVLSVLLHGLPFTCLWSCMGAETAKVVTLGVQPSTTLKMLVSGSTWFGVIVSPSLIGWWLNSLRAKRAKRQAAAANNTDL